MKRKVSLNDRMFFLSIVFISLNTLASGNYLPDNIVIFNVRIIIKIITILLLLYLIITLINPLIKEIKNGVIKNITIKIAEYILIVSFFLFMIYDILKIIYKY